MMRSRLDLPAPFDPMTPILAPGIERDGDVLQHRPVGRVVAGKLVRGVDEFGWHTPKGTGPRPGVAGALGSVRLQHPAGHRDDLVAHGPDLVDHDAVSTKASTSM